MERRPVKFLVLLLSSLILQGCGPGIGDYQKQIGNSAYRLVDTSPINRTIVMRDYNGAEKMIIRSSVLEYRYDEPTLGVLRQVVNFYRCKEGYIAAEVTDKVEYWIISTEKHTLSGPFAFADYREKLEVLELTESQLSDIPQIDESGMALRQTQLNNCREPQSI